MAGKVEPTPLVERVVEAVALLLQLGRVEHEAEIGEVEHGQKAEQDVGELHRPVGFLVTMGAVGASALPSLDASAEDRGKFLASDVLGVSVAAQGKENGGQLEVKTVEQGADSVRAENSQEGSIGPGNAEDVCRMNKKKRVSNRRCSGSF